MYIVYAQDNNTNLVGATRVGSCLQFTVAKIEDEAVLYNDLEALGATVITEDQFKGCKFAWAYKDTINIKASQPQFADIFPMESLENGIEKVPYTLTDEDKANAISFLKVIFYKLAKNYYDNQFDQIFPKVTKAEKELFLAQRLEAASWVANNSSPTPVLDKIATAKGITVAELVTRVQTKVAAYESAVADLVARQKAVEKEVNACTTLKELHYVGASRFGYSAFAYEWIHGATDVPKEQINL